MTEEETSSKTRLTVACPAVLSKKMYGLTSALISTQSLKSVLASKSSLATTIGLHLKVIQTSKNQVERITKLPRYTVHRVISNQSRKA